MAAPAGTRLQSQPIGRARVSVAAPAGVQTPVRVQTLRPAGRAAIPAPAGIRPSMPASGTSGAATHALATSGTATHAPATSGAKTHAPTLRYAPGLDGVRALAVLAVVAYHIGTTSEGVDPLRGGFLGVDVFFVLSGYLITSLLIAEVRKTGRISIRQFYLRRARRLLPALYVLLLAVGGFGAIWMTEQAAKLRGDLLAALGYATNWWLIAEDASYFGTGDRPRLLTHLWSLAVEEQFYLVWPVVLIFFARVRARRRLLVTTLVLGVAVSTAAAALIYDPWADPSRVYYGTDTRALAPLLGAALAVGVRPWRHRDRLPSGRRAALDLVGVLGLIGLAVLAVLLTDGAPLLYRGGFTVIALLAAAVVAVAGHPATLLGRVLGGQPLRWLGERSYAIYLWHWPVCALTRPGIDVPVQGWMNSALRVAAAVVLADLSYRLVERPMRRGGFFLGYPSRHAWRRPRLRLAVLRSGALAATAGVAASAIGFQLAAAAGRPVEAAPVDGGPAITLGLPDPADPSAGPSAKPSASASSVPRLAVFGDSQGMTLLVNRPADLGRYFTATDATVEGCGVLLGRVTSRSGERRDLTAACRNWKTTWAASAQRLHPRIALVILGAWEVFDLITPSGTLTFGSAAWDANLSAALQEGIGVLRAAGAKVALAMLPCYRPIKASAGFWPERGDDSRTRHINTVLRAAAAAAPEQVFTVDPPGQFCTDPVISTSRSYRWDGVHYFRPGAALYFRAVIPQLLRH
jgi:peptidoglycan/LPS O-acetylase OafA/YrhL